MFIGLFSFCFKQITNPWNITQKRHLSLSVVLEKLKDTTNHNGTTIFNQHLSFNVLSIDCPNILKNLTWAIFIHIKVQDDITLWSNLRQNLQLQNSLLKRDNRSTIRRGYRIWKFGTLLYGRFGLISCHNTGTRNNLTFAVCFHRRYL
ncbi:MAG: hypothetical protein ABS37_15220 [Acidovorax sp. SCN 65-108]|nr:MAG: hypothetical protein ABS37_15220 [Acidovorax sp. SCN 65-108]OJV68875.1 MAG: hypothetical protein BGO35_02440 [Burkholderiales bacterium 64-34]